VCTCLFHSFVLRCVLHMLLFHDLSLHSILARCLSLICHRSYAQCIQSVSSWSPRRARGRSARGSVRSGEGRRESSGSGRAGGFAGWNLLRRSQGVGEREARGTPETMELRIAGGAGRDWLFRGENRSARKLDGANDRRAIG